jgi:hypothetical protein
MSITAAFRVLFYASGISGEPECPSDRIMRQIGRLLDGNAPADHLN